VNFENHRISARTAFWTSPSDEDRSAYRKILFATFGFYGAVLAFVAGAVIGAPVTHVVMAALG